MIAGLKPYPRMKDSGVPWLGEVPEHWRTERAKWLFRKMDRPVKESDEVVTCFRDGTVTLRKNRRVRGFTESLKEIGYQGIRRGDLVIHAMDAFAGAVGVSDADGKGTPVYSVCEPGPIAVSHYYAYAIREMARSQWIQALAKGIRERSTDFRFEGFGSQPVPLPPLAEQAAIVRFLDHADRRIRRYIRAKQKLIKLLEEQKQAIIHQAVTGRIDVRTGQPYPAYKDSGVEWLGEVPEHWDVLPLKFLSKRIQNGATPPTSEATFYDNGVVPWYGPSSCAQGENVGAPVRYLAQAAFTAGRARLINHPALLVVVIGATAGRMAVLLHDGATNQQITSYELKTKNVFPRFLLHQLRGAERWLRSTASTATIPILDGNVVSRLSVAVPSVTEQESIVGYTDEDTAGLAGLIDRARREISLLHEYRTRLIADVVTGKLDVREATARLPDEGDEPLPDAADDESAPDDPADDLDAMPQEAEA